MGVLQERELSHSDSGVATLRRESNGRSESSAESHDVHEVILAPPGCDFYIDLLHAAFGALHAWMKPSEHPASLHVIF